MKHVLSLLFWYGLASLPLHASAQLPPYVPTNGLVAWYPFNGTTMDESGHGHHGTNNGATLTTDRFGIANAAYYFKDSASIFTSFDSSIGHFKAYTMSGWFQVWGIFTGGVMALKPGLDSISRYGVRTNSGKVLGHHYANGAFVNLTPYSANNYWRFVAISYDSAMLRLYVDGVKTDSATIAYPIPSAPSMELTIGNWVRVNYLGPGVTGEYFIGKIDDVGFWTRALTDSEISKLGPSPTAVQSFSNRHTTLWPNPVSDRLVIEVKQEDAANQYTIADLTGKVVCSGTFSLGLNVVNTVSLSRGVYVVRFRNEAVRVVKL